MRFSKGQRTRKVSSSKMTEFEYNVTNEAEKNMPRTKSNRDGASRSKTCGSVIVNVVPIEGKGSFADEPIKAPYPENTYRRHKSQAAINKSGTSKMIYSSGASIASILASPCTFFGKGEILNPCQATNAITKKTPMSFR